MRRRLVWALPLALAALAVVPGGALAGGGEEPVVVRTGNLVMTLNGNATPTRLPKYKLAPVSFHASGRIATVDGTHPPALKEVVLDAGKAGTIEANKFPSCSQAQLEATSTQQAEKKCRDAIIGRGKTEVEVQFPESNPFTAKGSLVIFNGGQRGPKSLLYIHAYLAVPSPTTVITPVVTTREHKGVYRLHSVAKIPMIAGGAGSPIFFYLNITRKGYLTANCSNGHFSAHVTALYRDGTSMSGSFLRPCTVA